jgi:hypothetical protein
MLLINEYYSVTLYDAENVSRYAKGDDARSHAGGIHTTKVGGDRCA